MRGLQSEHLTSRSRLPHGYGFKMAQFIRRRLDDDATDFSTEWDSANVGYAIAVSI